MRWRSLVGDLAGVAAGLDDVTDVDAAAVGGVGDVVAEPAGDHQVVLAAGADVGGVAGGVDDDERPVTGGGVGPPGRGGVVEHGVGARLDDPTLAAGRWRRCRVGGLGAAARRRLPTADGSGARR